MRRFFAAGRNPATAFCASALFAADPLATGTPVESRRTGMRREFVLRLPNCGIPWRRNPSMRRRSWNREIQIVRAHVKVLILLAGRVSGEPGAYIAVYLGFR